MRGSRHPVFLFVLVLASVLLVPMAASAGAAFPRVSTGDGTWIWQNPLPQGNDVHAGWGSSAADAVALTDGGASVLLHVGGGWTATTVAGMGQPMDISPTSETTALAISLPEDFSSAVWRTTDGGATWTRRSLLPDMELAAIDFENESTGWAVGQDYGATWGGVVMRTADGGSTWTKQSMMEEGYLYSVSFSSATQGWVGGYAPVGADYSDSMSLLLHTTDGGSTWTTAFATLASEDPSGARGRGFGTVFSLNATTTWVAEDSNVYRTTDGGSTFTTATIAGRPNAMAFADALNGWVLTNDWGSSNIQHTDDGGQTWANQSLPAGVDGLELNDLSIVSSSTAFVFGEGGIVLRTEDSGANWYRIGSGSTFDLRSVSFGDANSGWAVGEDQNKLAILRTTDHGLSWTSQDATPTYRLLSVVASGTQEAWAVGLHGTIIHTTDGGTTWESQTTTLTTYLNAVDFVPMSGHGWAVGGNRAIIHTADGGGTWVSQGSTSGVELEAVSAIDATRCWAAGDGGVILFTADGGSTWTTRSAGFAYDEYTGAYFTDADNGWVVGNDGSIWTGVMLRTYDGGRRWSRREYPTAGFNAISFYDALHGRAVSWTGDALYTADGGDTWSLERTGAAGSLFGLASVDATHTWAVGGNGAILFAGGGPASSSPTLPGPAPLPYTVTRVPVEGGTRFETAVKASRKAFADGSASTVVLATGRNWPDALGGAALAKAVGGPILLTETDSIPGVVNTEMTRLGATKVYVLGSDKAVSRAVATALQSSGKTVTRIGGANRYETARMVASETIGLLGAGYDGTAFAATGQNFPDALAASPISAANGWPIYLVDPNVSPASTIASMTAAGVSRVRILGSDLVVSDDVETSLRSGFGDGNVLRLEGANRYETAAAVAEYGVGSGGLGWNGVGIATGTNFPDALAGGVMLGKAGSVMLLTPGTTLAPATRQTLSGHKAEIDTVYILGGPSAVSQTVRDAVTSALR